VTNFLHDRLRIERDGGVMPNMHRPLRIVVPIHSLEPGGVERVALGLAAEWDRAGHHVTVVLGRAGSPHLVSAPDLRYWQIPTRRSTAPYETAWMIHCLTHYLVENRADILFCPGNTYSIVGAAMRVILGQSCPPIVLKVSNALDRRDMGPLMRAAYATWLRIHGSVFDRLVALSAPMQREIVRTTRAYPEQLAVISNPILTRERLHALGQLPPHAPSPFRTRYLSAGRLTRQKNFPLLLRAFARGARREDTLVIAGEGPERPALERLISHLGIKDRVSLPGHLPMIDGELAKADAFVLSSDYEGLPGVVVEAMAAGLPVIATESSICMAELLDYGRQGLLVPPGDEQALARAIHDVDRFDFNSARSRAIASRFIIDSAAQEYVVMMANLRTQSEAARRERLDLSTLVTSRPWQRSL